jgi:hypothetical protein
VGEFESAQCGVEFRTGIKTAEAGENASTGLLCTNRSWPHIIQTATFILNPVLQEGVAVALPAGGL